MSVEDKDRGWGELRRRIGALAASGTAFVDVGVLGSDASAPHADSGLSVAELATVHEFGATITTANGARVRIPERSFIRATIDLHRAKLQDLATKVGQGVLLGKFSPGQALSLLGEYTVGLIKDRITDGIPPPNAPSTIAKKGSSTPLIDTGQLRGSISYEVKGGA